MQNDQFHSHNHHGVTTVDDSGGENIRKPAQLLRGHVNSYIEDPNGWIAYTWTPISAIQQYKIQSEGGNETRPKNANVNYIIKY